MKQFYKVDENGFYIEPVILQDDENLPSDCIETQFPPLYKPKWNGTEWIETATTEELNEAYPIIEVQKTELEILKETVEALVLANLGV